MLVICFLNNSFLKYLNLFLLFHIPYFLYILERPTENGFDTVVFELPSYRIVEREGNYTDEEIADFRETVEKGAHLFFKYAREGGLKLA